MRLPYKSVIVTHLLPRCALPVDHLLPFWLVDAPLCVPEVRSCVDDASFLRALTVRFFSLEIRQNHNCSVRGLLPNLLTKKKTKEPDKPNDAARKIFERAGN